MSRYVSPLLFLIAGLVVSGYNATHADRVLAFPFLDDLFPSLVGNPKMLGRVSAGLLLMIGSLLLAIAARRPKPESDEG